MAASRTTATDMTRTMAIASVDFENRIKLQLCPLCVEKILLFFPTSALGLFLSSPLINPQVYKKFVFLTTTFWRCQSRFVIAITRLALPGPESAEVGQRSIFLIKKPWKVSPQLFPEFQKRSPIGSPVAPSGHSQWAIRSIGLPGG